MKKEEADDTMILCREEHAGRVKSLKRDWPERKENSAYIVIVKGSAGVR